MKRIKYRLNIMLCLIFTFVNTFCNTYSAGVDLSSGVKEIAGELAREFSADSTVIAVIPFVKSSGEENEFGNIISEELVTELYKTRKFSIVERGMLNKIIKENSLELEGVVDSQSAASLGMILGAAAVCTGTFTDWGSGIKLNVRMIESKTGKIVAATSVLIEKEKYMEIFLNGKESIDIEDEIGEENEKVNIKTVQKKRGIGSESILIYDNFDDGFIDSEIWTTDNFSDITERDGIMKLEQNKTDVPTNLFSKWISFDKSKKIIISRKVQLHFQVYPGYSWGDKYYYGKIGVYFSNKEDAGFSIQYLNDDYDKRHGIYIYSNISGTQSSINTTANVIFDEWFEEKIIYDIKTGYITLFINNNQITNWFAGRADNIENNTLRVAISPYGWWTKHYHYMDEFKLIN